MLLAAPLLQLRLTRRKCTADSRWPLDSDSCCSAACALSSIKDSSARAQSVRAMLATWRQEREKERLRRWAWIEGAGQTISPRGRHAGQRGLPARQGRW